MPFKDSIVSLPILLPFITLHNSTSRAAEWKEIQDNTTNKKHDAECPQTDCETEDG